MTRPSWVSPHLFPFDSQYFITNGGTMHYVDQGTGHPIIMVHGTPTWSFLYRTLITELSQDYRVIAPDHLGFGLSAKPQEAGYRPEDHARRLARFIEHLGLTDFTLIVHDFGGPIGLSYAINHPQSVDRIVLSNTWLWSLTNDPTIRFAHFIMRGLLGRIFYSQLNGSPRYLLKAAWGTETPLTHTTHQHYIAPFQSSHDRKAPWVLAKALLGSSPWYESLWDQLDSLTQKSTLILWGLKDPFFGEKYLKKWETRLPQAIVHRFPTVGHFVPDEAAALITPILHNFLTESQH